MVIKPIVLTKFKANKRRSSVSVTDEEEKIFMYAKKFNE